MSVESERGVWIVSSYEGPGFTQVTPFDDELLARRYADEHGATYLSVRYVEWGKELAL